MKLLLSHVADLDGITPIILLNLLDIDFEYELFDVNKLDKFIADRIDTDYFSKFDEIIITDLAITKETASKIIGSKYKEKFVLLDHHESNMYLNNYSFATVMEEVNGFKECATTILFKYLIDKYKNPILFKNSVINFVELVRECDTWQFTELKEEAKGLNSLFAFFGKDYFIDNYTNFLKKNSDFYFSEMELSVLKTLNQKRLDYLECMKDKVIIKKIQDYNIGVVFAEQYRSELGHFLAEKYRDKVDFIAIINMNYHISLRTVKDIKLNEFALKYGGGGHPYASGMPLKENIKDRIIDEIFGVTNEN